MNQRQFLEIIYKEYKSNPKEDTYRIVVDGIEIDEVEINHETQEINLIRKAFSHSEQTNSTTS